MAIIFKGNETEAFRDPTCYFHNGRYHLFFTKSLKENGYMYNMVARSSSKDLINWTTPETITQKDNSLNYCSPGSIIPYKDEYIMCITSYPLKRPYRQEWIADETARLFIMRTRNFETFSDPERLYPKGITDAEEEGRMIDPFMIQDRKNPEKVYLFFKQNGVSLSISEDMKKWTFCGSTEGGENACVLSVNGKYLLIHSPANGIGVKESEDMFHWKDRGVLFLEQDKWNWARGRLTAAFAMESQGATRYHYILFFHGSLPATVESPETHGCATLAIAFTDDFEHFYYEP